MNSPEKPLWKRIVLAIVLIGGFGITFQTAVAIYTLYSRRDIVSEKQGELERLETEQIELKNALSTAYSREFTEQEAREKLGLVKPGETMVILPETATHEADVRSVENSKNGNDVPSNQPDEEISILRQWWNIFF